MNFLLILVMLIFVVLLYNSHVEHFLNININTDNNDTVYVPIYGPWMMYYPYNYVYPYWL